MKDDFEERVSKYAKVSERLSSEADDVAYAVIVTLMAQFLACRCATEEDAKKVHKSFNRAVDGTLRLANKEGKLPWAQGTPH